MRYRHTYLNRFTTCSLCRRPENVDAPTSPGVAVCRQCEASISRSRIECGPIYRIPTSDIAVYGFFWYTDTVRRMLLRGKVGGDQAALRLIEHLASSHPLTSHLWQVETIIPVPSSLWGRLRGQLDVAHLLAQQFCYRAEASLHRAPAHLFWITNKQARKARTGKDNFLSSPAVSSLADRPRPILIVDDIVTTGFSISRLGRCLSGEFRQPSMAFCFAAAATERHTLQT